MGEFSPHLLPQGIPPRFAAASLKRLFTPLAVTMVAEYPAAIRGGLIEAWSSPVSVMDTESYSAAIRGGLIEATKRDGSTEPPPAYSAAIRGGLLEAFLRLAAYHAIV